MCFRGESYQGLAIEVKGLMLCAGNDGQISQH